MTLICVSAVDQRELPVPAAHPAHQLLRGNGCRPSEHCQHAQGWREWGPARQCCSIHAGFLISANVQLRLRPCWHNNVPFADTSDELSQ